jgi:hypothetical protein
MRLFSSTHNLSATETKYSHWCFVEAPFVRRKRLYELFFVDRVQLRNRCGPRVVVGSGDLDYNIADRAYHIGLVVKNPEGKGDSNRSDPDAVEKAATQVCRGLNGLIELLGKKPGLWEMDTSTQPEKVLIPVIFTTAKLYVSECDLSVADISTGQCAISDCEFREVDWLFYQYHLSPGIKHTATRDKECKEIAELLHYECVRTIPIVTAHGVPKFLSQFRPWE